MLDFRKGMTYVANVFNRREDGEWLTWYWPPHSKLGRRMSEPYCANNVLERSMAERLGWRPYVCGSVFDDPDDKSGQRYYVVICVKKQSKTFQALLDEGFVEVDLGS